MLFESASRAAGRIALVVLLLAATSSAQSAADKATARQLATDGVELYRKGQFQDALDKLQRAEKLYDAPVHLIYIARAQVKLGQLVEGAETYRRLFRTELDSSAPEVFQQAVADGRKELKEVEPRIPALRIDVEPADAEGLTLSLDGKDLSAAVVGVDRPTNPGAHKISAQAPGYSQAEDSVTLGEGDKKAIKLTLEKSADGGAGPGGGATGGGPKDEGGGGAGSKAEQKGKFGFVLGARLGGIVPTGNLAKDTTGDIPITDYYGGGGGLELRGGVRFLDYFTAHLFGGGYGVKSGSAFDQPLHQTAAGNTQIESQTVLAQAGVGLQAGTPVGQFGGFGELDFLFLNNFTTTQRISGDIPDPTKPAPATVAIDCSADIVAKSNGVRLGGGMNIPLSRQFQLTPLVMGTLATVTEVSVPACGPLRDNTKKIGKDNRAAHLTLFIGAGIDWLLGSDIPSK